jgi:glutamate synthase (NADPH/NADH) small chain
MGKITGFLEFHREKPQSRPVRERLKDWHEFEGVLDGDKLREQGGRCMDCGIPYCHTGCPLGNLIPDWNDFVYRDRWQQAGRRLHATNNFPEVTGRVCPAPCEEACVLNINDDPVGIKSIEHFIIDRGWDEGWVVPLPPAAKTGKRVAVVGSGPAGLACAQQLARAGHDVVLYEKADRIGGLLRYGIPDFKLERHLVDRRMAQMSIEGVEFRPGVEVGKDVAAESLLAEYAAVVLTGGAEASRNLPVPGRDLAGVVDGHKRIFYKLPGGAVISGDRVVGRRGRADDAARQRAHRVLAHRDLRLQ